MTPRPLVAVVIGLCAAVVVLVLISAAAVNFDRTGSTTLGHNLFDHSFLLPLLAMIIPAVLAGIVIGSFL